MKEVNSRIFGKVNFLEEGDDRLSELKILMEQYPANAFGIINKLLNQKGYMSSITEK